MINSLDNYISNLTSVALGILVISTIIYILFYTDFLGYISDILSLIIPFLVTGLFIVVFIFYPYGYVTDFIDCIKKNTSKYVNWKVFIGFKTPLMMLWIAGVMYIIKSIIIYFNL